MKELSQEVKAFAERMKQLREEKQLSRNAVSKEIGIHINSITEYERGRVPSLENLKKIKDYYQVSYEYLFGETNVKSINADIQAIHKETGLSEEAISFLTKLKKDDQLLIILNLLIEDMSKSDKLNQK
ncbi:MAG: helix-turn-helix transcriptional regulator [Bacilli bacterium]